MTALIRQYLHEEPAADLDEYLDQAALAQLMEERYFNNLARALGGKK